MLTKEDFLKEVLFEPINLERVNHKFNNIEKVIEASFMEVEGTGIRINEFLTRAEDFKNFHYKAQLITALPVKKKFRGYLFTKALFTSIKNILKNKKREDEIYFQFSIFDKVFKKSNERKLTVRYEHLNRWNCFDNFEINIEKTGVLNASQMIEDSKELLKALKKSLFGEITKYNKGLAENNIKLLKYEDDNGYVKIIFVPLTMEIVIFKDKKEYRVPLEYLESMLWYLNKGVFHDDTKKEILEIIEN